MLSRLDVATYVGRRQELEFLDERLAAAARGEGSLVLLAGEPGIGKTRTAEEVAAAAAARDMRALWGRCPEGEGAPAFWPWIQIVRAYVRSAGEAGIEPLLAGLDVGAGLIADMVPELRRLLPPEPRTSPLAVAEARFHVFDGLTTFFKRAADEHPLVLLLDDIHWADPASLLMLQFLVGELRDARLLVVAAYRDEEARRGRPLARVLGEVVRRPGVFRMTLAGLTEPDVALLVSELAGAAVPESTVAAIQRETDGSPLFVTELTRLLVAEGRHLDAASWRGTVPPTVRDVISSRLDRLTPRCARLLTLAAVLGREFSLDVLVRMTQAEPDLPPDMASLLEALAEAEEARVVEPAGSVARYRFSHALVRETLYGELTLALRPLVHRRAGIALLEVHEADQAEHLAEFAHHFAQAAPIGETDRAYRFARAAGDRALAVLAYEEAAEHYEQALALGAGVSVPEEERFELLLARAEAQLKSGDRAAAAASVDAAADLARAQGDTHRLARAALVLGGVSWSSGVVDTARIRLFEEAATALAGERSALHARVLAGLAYALYWTGDQDRISALSREALAMARESGEMEALADALIARHIDLWAPEHVHERRDIATEIVRLAIAASRKDLEIQGRLWMIRALAELAEPEGVLAQLSHVESRAADLRQPLFLWRAAMCRAALAMLRGQFDEADQLIQRAVMLGSRAPQSGAVSHYAAQLFALRDLQGRLAELPNATREGVEQGAAAPSVRCAVAWLFAELGMLAEARRLYDRLADDRFQRLHRDQLNRMTGLAYLSRLCAELDDPPGAAILYEQLLPHAALCVCSSTLATHHGPVAGYLGILAGVLRRWQEAEQHFQAALAIAERLSAEPFIAQIRYDYAVMLLARGDHGDVNRARVLLDQSAEAAHRLGMLRLRERAASRVLSIGDADHTSGPTEHDAEHREDVEALPRAQLVAGLTHREAEVLSLLARGRTSVQIAAELVLSVGTVRKHVDNIYLKIGAHSRAEATAFAMRNGLI